MYLLLFTVAALVTPESEHRAVTDGVGNCIFSAQGLPFKDEASYEVSKAFSTKNPIAEWRCYYPDQIKTFASKGAFYNQLRNEGEFYTYLSIEVPDGGRTFYDAHGAITPTSRSWEWDQQRFIASGSGCYTKDGGCIDIDQQVRLLAKEEGASLPYTAEVCFSTYYKWTDHYEERWDDFRNAWVKDRARVSSQRMAVGCVTHTAE